MSRVLHCPMFKTRAIADIERRERLSPVRAILGSERVRARIRKGSQKQEWAKLLKVGLRQGEATQEDKGKGKHREEAQMRERRASLRVRGGEAGRKATNTLDCRPRKPRLPIEGQTCSQALMVKVLLTYFPATAGATMFSGLLGTGRGSLCGGTWMCFKVSFLCPQVEQREGSG